MTVGPKIILEYPDLRNGKLRILALTEDKRVLQLFKRVCLEEAQLRLMDADDEILRVDAGHEVRKLQQMLDLLIPDSSAKVAADAEG